MGPPNGHPPLSFLLKQIGRFDKLLTDACLTKQSYAKNTHRCVRPHFWLWFFTRLDISMQYYMLELDKPSQELCVIVTLFSRDRFKWPPMGLKCAPDFALEVMKEVLHDIEDTGVHVDDVGSFSMNEEHHILLLDEILHCLEANGFTVNHLKYKWAIQETNWLGYWLMPIGLKSWLKQLKIDGVLQMQKTTTFQKYTGSLVLSTTIIACSPSTHTFLYLSPASPESKIPWDFQNGPFPLMHKSTYGMRLSSCLS